jgi:hypothetical protein
LKFECLIVLKIYHVDELFVGLRCREIADNLTTLQSVELHFFLFVELAMRNI